jgi:hypothetical protein
MPKITVRVVLDQYAYHTPGSILTGSVVIKYSGAVVSQLLQSVSIRVMGIVHVAVLATGKHLTSAMFHDPSASTSAATSARKHHDKKKHHPDHPHHPASGKHSVAPPTKKAYPTRGVFEPLETIVLDMPLLIFAQHASAPMALPPSPMTFPFSVRLPMDLPPSFRTRTDPRHHVQYQVCARVHFAKPQIADIETCSDFRVIPMFDSALLPIMPPSETVSAKKRFFWGGTGYLSAECHVSRAHVFPGDFVELFVKFTNSTTRTVQSIKAKVKEYTTWHVQGQSAEEWTTLQEYAFGRAELGPSLADQHQVSTSGEPKEVFFVVTMKLPQWETPSFEVPMLLRLERYIQVSLVVPFAHSLVMTIPITTYSRLRDVTQVPPDAVLLQPYPMSPTGMQVDMGGQPGLAAPAEHQGFFVQAPPGPPAVHPTVPHADVY